MISIAMIAAATVSLAPPSRCVDPDDSIPANARAIDSGAPCRRRAVAATYVLTPGELGKLKSAVTAEFKDPDSALFRLPARFSGTTICGLVNGKNSYGGYVGYKLFMAYALRPSPGQITIIAPRIWDAEDSKRWEIESECRLAGYSFSF